MKNIKPILLYVSHISIPIIIYFIIILYIFLDHGSGNSAEEYVKKYGNYLMIAYALIGIVHLVLIYCYLNMRKEIKWVLIILLFVIYFWIFYTNLN